jgi:hypothetical protein
MNPETLHAIWRSGAVHRWHHSKHHILRTSGDTVAAHSARVAMLVGLLFPAASEDTIMSALLHDAPESAHGDTGRMAKINSPDLKYFLEELSDDWFDEMGIFLTEIHCPAIKICDSLDAILWVASLAPYILQEREWQDHIAEVERMSWAISADVAAKVTGLLQAGGVR